MNIALHIEQVIIDGALGELDAAQVQAAVEAQLARLLAEGGLSPALTSGGTIASLRAAPIETSAPETLGQQIGGAVYASIGQQAGAKP